MFALAGELRRLAPDLLPPGGAAEATLTRTDSGIDLLLEASQPPGLGALEALARLGDDCDLARIVWRSREAEIPVVERRPVRVMLSGVAVPFPPGAFLQASETAERILVEEVLARVGPNRPVLDLFAGLGTFAFALAGSGPVHAVEGDERSAAALACAATDAPGVTVERRDLARDPLPPEALAGYAAAVFDPPRAGAARQASALAASSLDAVVAISCNPATFARDAARLIAGGFASNEWYRSTSSCGRRISNSPRFSGGEYDLYVGENGCARCQPACSNARTTGGSNLISDGAALLQLRNLGPRKPKPAAIDLTVVLADRRARAAFRPCRSRAGATASSARRSRPIPGGRCVRACRARAYAGRS